MNLVVQDCTWKVEVGGSGVLGCPFKNTRQGGEERRKDKRDGETETSEINVNIFT